MQADYTWTQIREELKQMADPKFQKFTSRLMPGVEPVLGVRLPLLRILAKKLVKGNWKKLLEVHVISYEEIMLQGMMIGYCKEEFELVIALIKEFLPKIDNWSVCDSFCSGLKITKDNPKQMWTFVKACAVSKETYTVRFAVVMILNYYVQEEYRKEALGILESIHMEEYYVKMAVAWALSIYFITFPKEMEAYLAQKPYEKWTWKKALQKITESRQVDGVAKMRIRELSKKLDLEPTPGDTLL